MLFWFNIAVTHDMRLIHTDLKPENILFISPDYVKVPDYKVLLFSQRLQSRVSAHLFIFKIIYILHFSSIFCSSHFPFLSSCFIWEEQLYFLLQVGSCSPRDGSCFKRLPKSSAIKVIDFGSTAYEHQEHNYIVSTRHYRAPEVILGNQLA